MSWNIEKPGDRINGPVTITGNTTLTGAATISGDLTVDTSTLKVDSANNRVGVGTATPSVPLDVVGNAKISGDLVVDTNTLVVDSANNRLGIGTASPNLTLSVAGDIGSNSWIGRSNIATPTADAALYRAADNTVAISTANVERFRIDSNGQIGIGATPSAWQSTFKVLQFANGTSVGNPYNGEASFFASNTLRDSGGNWVRLGSGYASMYYQVSGKHQWFVANTGAAASALSFSDGGQAMTLDASGNLLVGMTSAATSSAKTLHLANATAPSANPSGGGVLYVEGGALKYRGSSGTVTTIANA